MKARPWLEKEDPVWAQQVTWNVGREFVLKSWDNHPVTYRLARRCPLIEEARWYLATVPVFHGMERQYAYEFFEKLGRQPRAMAYLALIRNDRQLLKEAALLGDPIAQCRLTSNRTLSEEERIQWLTKSMQGGYSEAFCWMASIHAENNRLVERDTCLRKGIEAGSIRAMLDYARDAAIDHSEKIYWSGRVWLESSSLADDSFIDGAISWYKNFMTNTVQLQDKTEGANPGFIYGYIYNLLEEHRRERMSNDSKMIALSIALSHAQQTYFKMLRKAKAGFHAWSIVGRRLGVAKDIRIVIAKLVWCSRDQCEWL